MKDGAKSLLTNLAGVVLSWVMGDIGNEVYIVDSCNQLPGTLVVSI